MDYYLQTKHFPTPDLRKIVSALAGAGIRHSEIALYLSLGIETLRNNYHNELHVPRTKANVSVSNALFKRAIAGDVSAQKFWLQNNAGWNEGGSVKKVENDLTNLMLNTAKMNEEIKLLREELDAKNLRDY